MFLKVRGSNTFQGVFGIFLSLPTSPRSTHHLLKWLPVLFPRDIDARGWRQPRAEIKGRVNYMSILLSVTSWSTTEWKNIKNFPAVYDTNKNVYRKYVCSIVSAYVLYPVHDTNKNISEHSRGKSLLSSTVSEKLLVLLGHGTTPYAKRYFILSPCVTLVTN